MLNAQDPRPARRFAPLLLALLFGCGGAPGTVEVPADLFTDPTLDALIERRVADVEEEPQDPELRVELGLAFAANDAPELAEQAFRNALRLDADHAEAHFQIARILGARGDVEGERAELQRAIDADAKFLAAHYALGCTDLDAGDLDAAEASFDAVRAMAPDLHVGEMGLGLVAEERGDLDAAVAHLEAARALAPGDAFVRFRLGRVAAALGDDARAAKLLEGLEVESGRAEVSSPGDQRGVKFAVSRSARLMRANRLIKADRGSEAVGMLEALHRRDGADIEVATSLASAYLSAGRVTDARELSEATIARRPDEPLPRRQLAIALLQTAETRREMGVADAGRAQLVEALEAIDGAVDVAPDDAGVHSTRGSILAALRDDAEALAALRRAAALGGDAEAAYLAMRGPAERLGGSEAAIGVLREALGEGVDGPRIRFALVRALHGAGRADEAHAAARDLDAAAPGSVWALRASALLGTR